MVRGNVGAPQMGDQAPGDLVTGAPYAVGLGEMTPLSMWGGVPPPKTHRCGLNTLLPDAQPGRDHNVLPSYPPRCLLMARAQDRLWGHVVQTWIECGHCSSGRPALLAGAPSTQLWGWLCGPSWLPPGQ